MSQAPPSDGSPLADAGDLAAATAAAAAEATRDDGAVPGETPAAKQPFAVEIISCVASAWAHWLGPQTGLVGRAFGEGLASLKVCDLRDFGHGRHRTIDAAPYGGGAGMVLKAPPLRAAIAAARARTPGPVIMLSPRGAPLQQAQLVAWAQGPGLTLVCGRYEGVDERAYAAVDQEVSLGDFVLSGGDPAALCIVDALVRLLPGVLGNAASLQDESFADALLACPQYTRPKGEDDDAVPAVLQGGDHAAIARWRQQSRERLTRDKRPDLYATWAARTGASRA